MSVEEYRNNRKNKSSKVKKRIINAVNKILLSIIVILIGLIITNKNINAKEFINKYVYTDNIKFAKIKNIYNKYFGKYIGVDTVREEKVFNEKLNYKSSKKYKNGVLLSVVDNYLVPANEAGIVVFIGEKEDLGHTIIIEQINGINAWYSNLDIKDIKMYDYVKKGTLLGEVKDNKLYISFEREGKFLDYKKYI